MAVRKVKKTETAETAEPTDEKLAAEKLVTERQKEDRDRCRAVEDALFRRACGYEVSLRKTYKVKRTEYDSVTGKKVSEREELETGIEQEHVPADVRVGAYYLNNRDPSRWREHPQALSEELDGVVEFPDMEKHTTPPPSEDES